MTKKVEGEEADTVHANCGIARIQAHADEGGGNVRAVDGHNDVVQAGGHGERHGEGCVVNDIREGDDTKGPQDEYHNHGLKVDSMKHPRISQPNFQFKFPAKPSTNLEDASSKPNPVTTFYTGRMGGREFVFACNLQSMKMCYGGQNLRILSKLYTSVWCIIDSVPAGNVHLKARIVTDIYQLFNTYAITSDGRPSQCVPDTSPEPTNIPVSHRASYCDVDCLWGGDVPMQCGYHGTFGRIFSCLQKCPGAWVSHDRRMGEGIHLGSRMIKSQRREKE